MSLKQKTPNRKKKKQENNNGKLNFRNAMINFANCANRN